MLAPGLALGRRRRACSSPHCHVGRANGPGSRRSRKGQPPAPAGPRGAERATGLSGTAQKDGERPEIGAGGKQEQLRPCQRLPAFLEGQIQLQSLARRFRSEDRPGAVVFLLQSLRDVAMHGKIEPVKDRRQISLSRGSLDPPSRSSVQVSELVWRF